MSAMREEWRAVVGFEGYYEVSNFGRVRRIKPSPRWPNRAMPIYLSPSKHKKGYTQVVLYRAPSFVCRKIHVLVAQSFIGARPGNATINHKDFDKANNCVSNLEYVSASDNVRHAYTFEQRRQAQPRGVKHHNAVLTEARARKIQRKEIGRAEAVRRWGISRSTYDQVRSGKTWRHLL
jgi:hypothetical protein